MQVIPLEMEVPLEGGLWLKAGGLSCWYADGALRYISVSGKEVVRMIYGALRDPDWVTVPFVLKEEVVQKSEDRFLIRYTALYEQEDIRYEARFEIEGRPDSSLRFQMKGRSLSGFRRNRIGLCVLHPLGTCAGRKVTIEQPDGSTYTAAFPDYIAPHQPFRHVQGMTWSPVPGSELTLRFRGEVFETEDQRNWGDASFKTYGTPLHLPFPVRVEPGEELDQEVLLSCTTLPPLGFAFGKEGGGTCNALSPDRVGPAPDRSAPSARSDRAAAEDSFPSLSCGVVPVPARVAEGAAAGSR